ncbi:MAG: CPBP family intramembrane glutamic endopeptidase [Terriglobia bacterium]
MELRIYSPPAAPSKAARYLPRWVRAFEAWAAPAVAPEEEGERSLTPVALLLGLALILQYAQLGIPAVHAYLQDFDIGYRASWAGFTVIKHAFLFVLLLIALQVKEEPLVAIGFPRLDARRWSLALGLAAFFLGAALLRAPDFTPQQAAMHWGDPVSPGERTLWVLLALSAAVVEETLFRGFALVWTYRWSGHLPLAVLFPALVFAAGHAYAGWVNVGFAFVAALVFSGIFLWRRELYWPMVIHFVFDAWILLA